MARYTSRHARLREPQNCSDVLDWLALRRCTCHTAKTVLRKLVRRQHLIPALGTGVRSNDRGDWVRYTPHSLAVPLFSNV